MALGLVVLLGTLPAAGQDSNRELTLDEAIRLAKVRNPGFQASLNDADVANWTFRSSLADLVPSAQVTSLIQYQGSGESRLGSIRLEDLGLSSSLPAYYISSFDALVRMELSGPKLLKPFQARAQQRATNRRVDEAELALEQNVVRHYLEVLRSQDAVALADQEMERATEDLRLAQVRNEMGSAADWEVQRARVTQGRAEVGLLQARNDLRTATLRLAQQIGLPPEEPLTLTSHFEIFEPTWDESHLYETALVSNPELGSLRAEEDAAGTGVTMARSQYLPSFWLDAFLSGFTRHTRDETRLLLEAENAINQNYQECLTTNDIYSRLTPALPGQDCSVFQFGPSDRAAILAANDAFPFKFITQPPIVTFGLSIPLFQGLGRKREVERARAEAEDARFRLEERELALRADLAASLGLVRTTYQSAQLEEINAEVASQQLRLARERYEMGSGSFLELVEAETVKASADQALLDALYSFHQAVVDLETLVGRPLRNPAGG
jgi:outer membrane protein TolC